MKFFKFLLHSVTAGLALAFVVVVLKPELLGTTDADSARAAARSNPVSTPATTTPGASVQVAIDVPSYADAVAAAAPAVVNLLSSGHLEGASASALESPDELSSGEGSSTGSDRSGTAPVSPARILRSRGSGVILDARGYIVTNHHLISAAGRIRVTLRDGREARAEVVGTDPETDLAVLRVELDDLPVVAINASRPTRVGDVALAIGNPFGVGQTVTMGIVSATGRSRLGLNTFEDFIQTDAAINPGNSGGALINSYGELLGINTAIISDTGGSQGIAQGIGFAIPAGLAKDVLDQIIVHGHVVRGWVGVEVQDVSPAVAEALRTSPSRGAFVANVLTGTPAEQAGLRAGDLIIKVGDEPVANARDVLHAIASREPGEVVGLSLLRNGERRSVDVTVAQRPLSP